MKGDRGRWRERKKGRNKNPLNPSPPPPKPKKILLSSQSKTPLPHTHTHSKEIAENMLLNMFLFDTLPKQNKTKNQPNITKFCQLKQQVTSYNHQNKKFNQREKALKNIRGNNKHYPEPQTHKRNNIK